MSNNSKEIENIYADIFGLDEYKGVLENAESYLKFACFYTGVDPEILALKVVEGEKYLVNRFTNCKSSSMHIGFWKTFIRKMQSPEVKEILKNGIEEYLDKVEPYISENILNMPLEMLKVSSAIQSFWGYKRYNMTCSFYKYKSWGSSEPKTVKDILVYTENDYKKEYGIGYTSIEQLRKEMNKLGIDFNKFEGDKTGRQLYYEFLGKEEKQKGYEYYFEYCYSLDNEYLDDEYLDNEYLDGIEYSDDIEEFIGY